MVLPIHGTVTVSLLCLLLTVATNSAFTFSSLPSKAKFPKLTKAKHNKELSTCFLPLFMGRAASVRAATKSKTDAKKSKTNSIYGKKIMMAVKSGGSADPNANGMLASVIKQAKANNVPVDNINRAIKNASEVDTSNFSESTFEAYGFGGASFIINVLSDNPNRASMNVKSAVNKLNGKIAEQGSVIFMYDQKGRIVTRGTFEEDDLFEAAIEAGCDDLEVAEGEEENTTIVYSNPKEMSLMIEALNSIEKEIIKSEIVYVSKAPVECTDKDFEKNMKIIDALEEFDDVDNVEHNMLN